MNPLLFSAYKVSANGRRSPNSARVGAIVHGTVTELDDSETIFDIALQLAEHAAEQLKEFHTIDSLQLTIVAPEEVAK